MNRFGVDGSFERLAEERIRQDMGGGRTALFVGAFVLCCTIAVLAVFVSSVL